jgi:eukaryotic-like serine/threonine-protein kinase
VEGDSSRRYEDSEEMSNKIGRFEIINEIARSEIGCTYKASDTETGHTVALKTINLQFLGDQAEALVQRIVEEAEASKPLSSQNIAVLYGAGDIDDLLCAAMDYVQGNSIATMLARKEGFSIWDLQDITRQTCQALDHARVHKVVHYSLEPAKIMVQWDGTVKILSFGISGMGAHAVLATGKAPEVLHYLSPEQLRGDPMDARSNLFTLGAILYEMVTERKAFDAEDADQLRQQILEQMPVAPDQINAKIHPALSEVIMKALVKAPEGRYASGQDLVTDMERCKESATKAAAAKKPSQPAQGVNVPRSQTPAPAATAAASVAGAAAKLISPKAAPGTAKKAVAAAAGAANTGGAPTPRQSAAIAQPERETAPGIVVDPMMDESKSTGTPGRSFSEMDELPPRKEVYIAPPPSAEAEDFPSATAAPPATMYAATTREKPRVQPRQVAKQAVTEIKKTPPKLFMYSIGAAVCLILAVTVGIAFHVSSQDKDENADSAVSTAPASNGTARGKRSSSPEAPAQTSIASQDSSPVQAVAPERIEAESAPVTVTPRYNRHKAKVTPPPRSAIIPGQLTINSTPEGAQVRIDGRTDPSWVTPYNLPGLAPGQHSVSVSKAGYAAENRTIDVASASKSFLVVQLAQITATAAVTSTPAGAAIFVDGKDSGRLTPAQIPVDRPGSHTFLVRKQGYLEEATTVNLQAGQTYHFAPTLRVLGNTGEIKTVGKFKKIFGGGGETSGMGTVSVKTQPKSAQIAVNRRVLDKSSPVEFYLNPGAYVVDITLSGYKTIHRVVNAEKGNKVTIDETLERQ